MSEHELSTLLRDVEPVADHPPSDVGALWLDGRRRSRRTRTAWVTGAGLVVVALLVAGIAVVTTGDRREPSRLDVADAPEEPPVIGSTAPASPPTVPPGAERPEVDGFPMALGIDRKVFRAGDGGEAEVRLSPVEWPQPVTIAIPLALERWDATTEAWVPVADLYDLSRSDHASWLPPGVGPAWYEWAPGTHGLPVRLPVDDVEPGDHRVCARVWRSAEGPPVVPAEPPTEDELASGVVVDAPSIDLLPLARVHVRLCTAITIAGG